MFTFSTKLEIKHFLVVVVQKGQINVQKSVMHVQVVVLLIKPIDILDVLVAVASLDLYVPKNQSMRERCWLRQRGQLFSHINSR